MIIAHIKQKLIKQFLFCIVGTIISETWHKEKKNEEGRYAQELLRNPSRNAYTQFTTDFLLPLSTLKKKHP